MQDTQFLNPPPAIRKVFKQNFIRASIVEFRFPTIIGFGEDELKKLSSAVRKEFPKYSKTFSGALTDSGISPSKSGYTFEGRKPGQPTFHIDDSSMSITMSNYVSFEIFIEQVKFALDAAKPVLDCDFLTRVGYRVVNEVPIPTKDNPIKDYIKPELVEPLDFKILGILNSSKFEVQGKLDAESGYLFRYGTPENAEQNFDSSGNLNFMLDYDYFTEDVDIGLAIDKVEIFHSKHFDFFWWCLEKSAREILQSEE